MTAELNLLPCPFCGGKPDLSFRVYDTASFKTWGVSCCVEMEGDTDREATVAAWNRRATPAATAAGNLLQLARDFYNTTVADTDVRIISKSEAKRDIAAKAADKLRDAISAALAAPVAEKWLPTPENVNALPEGVRKFVHDLASRCDPAGDVAALTGLQDQLDGVQLMYRKAADALDEVRGCFKAAEVEGLSLALAETHDERLKDLVERRLMYALYASENVTSAAPVAAQADTTDILRDMLAIQEACGLHTDEYAPGSVIEYIKELEADSAVPSAGEADTTERSAAVATVNAGELPAGWMVERRDNPPFRSIAVKSPDGKVALLSSLGHNPENVFYEFADALLTNRAPATGTGEADTTASVNAEAVAKECSGCDPAEGFYKNCREAEQKGKS